MSPTVQRHFIGWNSPVLVKAGEWLLSKCLLPPFDLSHLLVVVPTRQSGRRLREQLARLADARGSALIPPQVVTPHSLFNIGDSQPGTVDKTTHLAAWTHTLRTMEAKSLPALFPTVPETTDLRWALAAAHRFMSVQQLLGECGESVADVVARDTTGHLLEEPERWQNLATLEQKVNATLHDLGFVDPISARATAISELTPPTGIRELVLLATPDPMPFSLRAVERLGTFIPVHVVIHAPESLDHAFDKWGRPRTEVWARYELEFPEQSIKLLPDALHQSNFIPEFLAQNSLPPADIAIGVPDPDLIPYLHKALADKNLSTYDPAGVSLSNHPLVTLVRRLSELANGGSYESLSELFRHPDYLRYLVRSNPGLSITALLIDLDQCRMEHFPVTFADVRHHLRRAPDDHFRFMRMALDHLHDNLSALQGGATGQRLLAFLAEVHQQRVLDRSRPDDNTFAAAAEQLSALLCRFDDPLFEHLGFDRAEKMVLLEAALTGLSSYLERQPDSIDLLGWLELHWDDAPCLIITGMNDGRVPETVVGDAFVPDTLRTLLKLPNNATRFARDAYLAAAILNCRPPTDENPSPVTLLVGKISPSRDPLRPSRLLFRCSDAELPDRVERLFQPAEAKSGTAPLVETGHWLLMPPSGKLPGRMSPTAFKDYLACPFRFYLKRLLHMDSVDDRVNELDAMQFGTLCHAALESFGLDSTIRDSSDASQISEFLHQSLDEHLRAMFGQHLPITIAAQAETARQRLTWAARVQAAERDNGWRIIATEKLLEGSAGGLPIIGRIDRLDRHEDGHYRILDYKTWEKLKEPQQTHLRRARDNTPYWQQVEVNGKPHRFTDLQLPIYAWLLQQDIGPNDISAGYFQLPKAVTETRVSLWEQMDHALIDRAVSCATNIIEAILDWQFWPPAESVEYDNFEFLFSGPAEVSVDGQAFGRLLKTLRKGDQ
jgi:ATP-dependent helicase/nuclease subunit B